MLIGTSANPKEISDLNTGIFTIYVSGINIAKITKRIPKEDTKVSIPLLENFAPNEPPYSRSESRRRQNHRTGKRTKKMGRAA